MFVFIIHLFLVYKMLEKQSRKAKVPFSWLYFISLELYVWWTKKLGSSTKRSRITKSNVTNSLRTILD